MTPAAASTTATIAVPRLAVPIDHSENALNRRSRGRILQLDFEVSQVFFGETATPGGSEALEPVAVVVVRAQTTSGHRTDREESNGRCCAADADHVVDGRELLLALRNQVVDGAVRLVHSGDRRSEHA